MGYDSDHGPIALLRPGDIRYRVLLAGGTGVSLACVVHRAHASFNRNYGFARDGFPWCGLVDLACAINYVEVEAQWRTRRCSEREPAVSLRLKYERQGRLCPVADLVRSHLICHPNHFLLLDIYVSLHPLTP